MREIKILGATKTLFGVICYDLLLTIWGKLNVLVQRGFNVTQSFFYCFAEWTEYYCFPCPLKSLDLNVIKHLLGSSGEGCLLKKKLSIQRRWRFVWGYRTGVGPTLWWQYLWNIIFSFDAVFRCAGKAQPQNALLLFGTLICGAYFRPVLFLCV